MENEREIALNSLIQILENGAYSHVIEKQVLDKYDYLDSVKKAFIKRVIEGTVENMLVLDEVINKFSKTPTNRQKPMIRTILRMSTYQILFMEKVPDFAACNEAANLAARHGFKTLKPFVNGVLRTISKNKDDCLKNMGSSVPEWIKVHLIDSYGEETASKILEDIDKPHPVTIRVRNSKFDTSSYTPSPLLDDAFFLPKGTQIAQIKGYDEGDFIVQDISSMMVCKTAEIKPGEQVLDVCAAPGGKSIHACDMGGEVLSRDLYESKVERIRENIERCGCTTIRTEVFDATVFDSESVERYDVVLADLPCSGLGVMGRKADIRFKTKPEDLDSLADIQRNILDTIWQYVKVGGILMYSTCTLNPEENENQAKYLVEKYAFELKSQKTFFPGIDGTDGFYIAKLQRTK